jgi:hypothetical protein
MSTRSFIFLTTVALVVTGTVVTTLRTRPESPSFSLSPSEPRDPRGVRRVLFDLLQPVSLANCTLERFGEPHDGGYLMCANLLGDARTGYSYGISGYDKWGCDISTKLNVAVHQYDCFNLKRPRCEGGQTVFHEECVGDTPKLDEDGRLFDTIERQLIQNGDKDRHVVMKMDVEGAEWDSFLQTPDHVLDRIDQLAIELHGVSDARFVAAIKKLKRFFFVAHVHVNNYSCAPDIQPFPAWAIEVLFVNRRLGTIDWSGAKPPVPHPLDAPNKVGHADCQIPQERVPVLPVRQ